MSDKNSTGGTPGDRVPQLEAALDFERDRSEALEKSLQESRAENQRLARALQDQQRTLEELQDQLRIRRYELGERVRELHCLFSVSRLFENRELSRGEIFKGLVDAIPPSWQYPKQTCACIRYVEGAVCSEDFQPSPWKLSCSILVRGRPFGELEVYYSEEKPERDEGPFLKEERELLNELARRLGVHLERLQAEERAKENERFYRELFELGLIGMAVIDPNSRQWLALNERLCQMLGYTADELKHMAWTECIHPEDTLAGLREFEKALRNRQVGNLMDKRFVRKDGSVFHATLSFRSVRSPEGDALRVYVLLHDITERVQAEQRFIQSLLMVQHIFDTIDTGLCLVGKDLRVLRTNATFAKLMHLEVSIVGRDLYDALAGVYVPKEFCPVQRAFVNKRIERTEHRIFYPNEGERWFEVHGYPITDGGSDAEVVMLIRDITAQKKAQSTLSERLDFIQTLINAVPNPIFYKDGNGVYQGCNRSFEEFMQTSAEELIGRTTFDIAPAELAAFYDRRDKELLRNPGVQIYESHLRRGDGELRDVLFYKATYGKYAHNPTGIVGVVVDITDRKHTEEALRENAELLRVIFETIQTALVIVDAQTLEIVDVNRNAEELTGCSKTDLVGKKCAQMLPGFFSAPHDKTCENCPYEGEGMLNKEDVLLRPDGRTVPVLRSVLPITLKGRKHIVEIAFDLSEHKALEQQLVYAKKLESIGLLAAEIARGIDAPIHDAGENIFVALKAHATLMTLLDALVLDHQARAGLSQSGAPAWQEAETLLLQSGLEAYRNEIPDALRLAAEGVGRVAEVIQGLTKFSGASLENMRPEDINAAIENTVLVSRNEWQSGATVHTDLDPGLPLVFCRLSDFNQVVLHLLLCAAGGIGNTREQEEKVRIDISTRKEGRFVAVTLRDPGYRPAGEGFKGARRPLTAADTTNAAWRQALLFARSVVVNKFLGSMDVRSSREEGTDVTLRIPIEKEAADASE